MLQDLQMILHVSHGSILAMPALLLAPGTGATQRVLPHRFSLHYLDRSGNAQVLVLPNQFCAQSKIGPALSM